MIPRPQTIKSSNKDKQAKNKSSSQNTKTSQNNTKTITPAATDNNCDDQTATTNITIIQVSSPVHTAKEKFIFPSVERDSLEDDKYKSNVQIIPSNFTTQSTNQFSVNKVKTKLENETKITTVQVSNTNAYGKITKNTSDNKIKSSNTTTTALSSSPIPSPTATIVATPNTTATTVAVSTSNNVVNGIRNFGGITNIPIGVDKITNSITTTQQSQPQHYEQVFLTSSPSITSTPTTTPNNIQNENGSTPKSPKFNFLAKQQKSASHSELHINRINLNKPSSSPLSSSSSSSSNAAAVIVPVAGTSANSSTNTTTNGHTQTAATTNKAKTIEFKVDTSAAPAVGRPLLTRGYTEAVILRPSRKDGNAANRPHGKAQQVSAKIL